MEINMRTAGEAGWHLSRYNIMSKIPDTDFIGVANLYHPSFVVYGPAEAYLLSVAESLDEDHPILDLFRQRGEIVDFDERERLGFKEGPGLNEPDDVSITISVTMACNFDCTYCFERHTGGRMTAQTQEDVIALTARMLDASHKKNLFVTWFGGEPLLATDIIESMSERLMAVAKERGVEYAASIGTNGYLLTQEIVDMLGKNRVQLALISLDGIGSTHDKTRHLADGSPSFERITENLRSLRLPFQVRIRQIVFDDNRDEVDAMRDFVSKLAKESGNNIIYEPDIAFSFIAQKEDGQQMNMVSGEAASRVGILRDVNRFARARGRHCESQSLWHVEIDSEGRLHKCKFGIDHPEFAFGNAADWDPAKAVETASAPANLQGYRQSPLQDEECRECVWLPFCGGGCPHFRLHYKRECIQYKDDPEGFILGLYRRLEKES